MSAFRHCDGPCKENKTSSWFDLEHSVCNRCGRMSPAWTSDQAKYPRIFGNIRADIDWTTVTCGLCRAKLFAEEIRQAGGARPGCQRGFADIIVESPLDWEERCAEFSSN